MLKSELAALYQVSTQTFVKWLKLAGIDTGKRKKLTPLEVSLIYQKLGEP